LFFLLQRIALAYLVVAVIEIATKDERVQDQSSSGFSIFRLYLSQWYIYMQALMSSEL
jgi:heparan-alpha-glucosaminide N-acetyltransferase